MTVVENLNDLEQKVASAKEALVTNLTAKGVSNITTANTLTELSDSVTTIPSGGGGGGNQPFDFASIGYVGNEEPLKSGLEHAKEIYDTWDATQTNLYNKYYRDKKLHFMPLVDTSRVNNMQSTFAYCSSLISVPQLDTSSVTIMQSTFAFCSSLISVPQLDTSRVQGMNGLFTDCEALSSIPLLDISSCRNMNGMLNNCKSITKLDMSNWNSQNVVDIANMCNGCNSLTSVTLFDISTVNKIDGIFNQCGALSSIILKGNPSNITSMKNMFSSSSWNRLRDNGTLIYDYKYDYSKIIEELHKFNPTWTAKPNYEPQECTSLTITADDVVGNSTTTTVHYTAMTNGVNSLTGERLENVEVKGDATSEPFGENPSYDTSRQVTVTFNYLGQTATTTITQGVKMPPTVTVDLMSNWELAPTETIPNPNLQLYEGVYQSVHKGQGNVKDKMVITFIDMPNFELYIRSNAESNYDYMYCGKLDESEPTEYASTKGKQNAGTALENYIKVEYPNDGGEHSVTVVYRKDSSGDSGDDRGYIFFTKPQE